MVLRLLNSADAERADPIRIESPQREVITVTRDDVPTILVVEPVLVTPAGLGFGLADLNDLDLDDAPEHVALALVRDGDQYTLEPFTADTAGYLTEDMVGVPGGLAELGPDGRLVAAQRPPEPERGYRHTQFISATRWQVRHDLGYDPAGVLVRDIDGEITEPANVIYPLPGVIELEFGAAVTGTVWLS